MWASPPDRSPCTRSMPSSARIAGVYSLVGREQRLAVRLAAGADVGQPDRALVDQLAHERVAVGMEPAAGQADDRVARLRLGAIDQLVALDEADAEAGQVERVGGHHARMLGRLAADERAADVVARLCHARHERRDARRIDLADGHVVEEEGGLGAVADDVVGAHRDEIDADRVEPAQRARDLGLGAHAVGGRHEHRLLHARWDLQRGSEAADAAEQVELGDLQLAAQQVDGALAGLDVDARLLVGRAEAHPSSSDDCQRLALEQELVVLDVVRDGHRVVAVEAGEAEPLARQVDRVEHAADRQVRQRIGADELADLLGRAAWRRSARSRSGCRCRRSTGGRSAAR